jgi:hypothetical protein
VTFHATLNYDPHVACLAAFPNHAPALSLTTASLDFDDRYLPDPLKMLFPSETPAHEYLRSLGAEMLGRPDGVPRDNTPFSISYTSINGLEAASAYYTATGGQLPSELLQDPIFMGHFIVRRSPHTSSDIVMFSAPVLKFLMGGTHVPPGKLGKGSETCTLQCTILSLGLPATDSLHGLPAWHGAEHAAPWMLW